MTGSNTIRTHCLECDPERRKSKSLARTTDELGVVEYCHRCQYTHAENHLAQVAPIEAKVRTLSAPPSDKLAAIWARTQPLRSTIGEKYLQHRRCVLPPSDSDLRFLPGSDRYPPSLCALVTNAVTAEPMTLQFTRLARDGLGKAGTDNDKPLLAGHPKKGGVIRLWPDTDVRYGLGVAEGTETALSAAHACRPVWSCIDAGNLGQFPVLLGVESLTIFADHDEAGLKAARACARRWHDAGREVRALRAPTPTHDIADEAAAA